MYYVYILYSEKLNKYYIGRTEDLELRLKFHNEPIESRKFTARGVPWILKWSARCNTLAQSVALEKYIKAMKSRRFIEQLLQDEIFSTEIIAKVRAPDC
jgi:putative endonuclease